MAHELPEQTGTGTTVTRRYWALLREAGVSWCEDNASRMSSSLAYYTLLSITPIVLLVVSIAALFMGAAEAKARVVDTLSSRIGAGTGLAVESIVNGASDPGENILATLAGLFVLVAGASGVFGELHSAMNAIWLVEVRPGRGLFGMLYDRIVCFAMVGSVTLLLLLLLIAGALLALLGTRMGALPGGVFLWQLIDLSLSFIAATWLFAITYKTVPDVKIPYREIWPGALLTAGLFILGQVALDIYFSMSAVPKPYGAAGAIIVLVTWIYYSGQILFYGAEFTKVRVASRGVTVRLRTHAMRKRAPAVRQSYVTEDPDTDPYDEQNAETSQKHAL